MILPKVRDRRFITVRRGGTLSDEDHHLLALWAADCAEHVLPLFQEVRPDDDRPRRAIELARAWARGEIRMTESRTSAGHADAAARDLRGAARHAAYAAAQAAAVAHVPAHELGAAAYAIRAVQAAAAGVEPGTTAATTDPRTGRGARDAAARAAGRAEDRWQRAHLPLAIRELVLDDERLRNDLCWRVFED
ncbi:MAG TPA: hypothetical protein VFW92_11935 [Candidatus Limnocylindrales bacterium]|nr:hypothetical protein [Candidatus Limnocylindrales bacterium]